MAKKKNISKMKINMPSRMEYSLDLSNSKMRNKCIERIKKIVRGSIEYKDYIQFIKESADLGSCIFLPNVNQEDTGKSKHISIEMHHEPLTITDIIDTVVRKYEENGEEINELLIADEVLELHYANKVGLVPLSKTAHAMVHNSAKLMVPLNCVYGEYSKFVEEYEDYISDEVFEKLERKSDMTKRLTPESFEALLQDFTYIEMKGVEDVEKMELDLSKDDHEEVIKVNVA